MDATRLALELCLTLRPSVTFRFTTDRLALEVCLWEAESSSHHSGSAPSASALVHLAYT